MNMQAFQVFSPQAGLVTDQPSILLPVTATPDIQDMYFQSGEVKRFRKRLELFSALPDAVISQYEYNQASEDRKYFLYLTKRDVCYRDRTLNRYVFINPRISNMVIDSVSSVTGNKTSLTVSFGTGYTISDISSGDFIRIGDNTSDATTDDTWYEVVEIIGNDTIIVNGDMPTGYQVPTSGDVCLVRQTFSGLDTDIWVCDTASETFIATNNGVDYPIYWNGGDAPVEQLTTDFKCKWLNYFGGRVIASYIISNGNLYPVNYRWSGLLNFTDWGQITGSDSGETSLTEGRGYISRGLVFRDFLYIFKSESIERIWAVDSEDIFNTKVLRVDLGTKAPHSFIVYRDIIYFYATLDRTFRRFDGFYDSVISKEQDPTIKNITMSAERTMRAYFVNDTRQLLWSVPYAGSTTLNKILIADIDYNKSPWTIVDMEAVSFGRYEISNDYAWSTLPFNEWASWNWESWRTSEGAENAPLDCVAGYDGKIYQMNASRLDNGEEYESYIVFETDFSSKSGALPQFKRLLKIQAYTRDKGTGSVDIQVKRDLEENWQDAGSFNLNSGREINISIVPMDYRAKSFKIKFSSTFDFEIVGFVCWFIPTGAR
jgi:hypothetical protein